jgi:hypothetical protein
MLWCVLLMVCSGIQCRSVSHSIPMSVGHLIGDRVSPNCFNTWPLSCDSQNETWTKSQLDGEVRHENKSLCGWNRHQSQWCVTKNDSESSTVVYRCPLSQILLFHRTFSQNFGDFPRNFDGTDAIPVPRLVVTPEAITPACLPAPSYPCITLPPSLRHATGARWLLWLKILPSISKPYRSNSDRRDR